MSSSTAAESITGSAVFTEGGGNGWFFADS
ncbi:hypothetical protein AB6A40_010462 [Gnathostoma spinigerum]|uniref:Uncharacterized protein n=1 Tax=Gnathostoma spinigerum TaxID=75299 RepID=A0ABD6EUX4_9BILA